MSQHTPIPATGRSDKITLLYMTCLLMCAIVPWFNIHFHASITADSLWLADAAQRLLAGGDMTKSFFDPNPPLSILLYVPVAAIVNLTGVAVYHALFFYTLGLLTFFSIITFRLVQKIPGSDAITAALITIGVILANTVLTSISFTERDQIIGMALIPLALTQLGITYHWDKTPRTRHIILLIGSILVLVKPHYGLLSALIILHRAITQKRISIWKDPDFVYLAAATVSYIVVCFAFFDDYIYVVLPDVIKLYLGDPNPRILLRGLFYVLVYMIALMCSFMLKKGSWLTSFFIISAIINLIPFVVQMRGYHYHLLPATGFFVCGLALLIRDGLQGYLSGRTASIAALVTVIALSFTSRPLLTTFPTHADYKTLPLTKVLEECDKPCPFFVFNNNIEIVHQTGVYTDRPWASRFPSYWFIPAIYKSSDLTEDERMAYRKKYGRMAAEDLTHYKPKLILIGEFRPDGKTVLDYFDFFNVDEQFRAEWKHYRRTGDVTVNQQDYFKGTKLDKPFPMTYQIFERKPGG